MRLRITDDRVDYAQGASPTTAAFRPCVKSHHNGGLPLSYRYTVTARFTSSTVAEEWVEWLLNGHCEAVVRAGALRAEIVAMDTPPLAFDVRYDFIDREAFENYERTHAPALRDEGIALFPPSRGIEYARTMGSLRQIIER